MSTYDLFDNLGIKNRISDDHCALAETDLGQKKYQTICDETTGEKNVYSPIPFWDDLCWWPGGSSILCYDKFENDEQCCIYGKPRDFTLGQFVKRIDDKTVQQRIGQVPVLQCTYNNSNPAGDGCNNLYEKQGLILYKRYPHLINQKDYTLNPADDLNDVNKQLLTRINLWGKAQPDKLKNIMTQTCNDPNLLANEGYSGVCHKWCRENPGMCDASATTYCKKHIVDECGSMDKDEICVTSVIDPFCSCLYWSDHGLAQPQCFSPTCQAGRGGQSPGYRTASMKTEGEACGVYCKQQVSAIAAEITLSGNISQRCDFASKVQNDKQTLEDKPKSDDPNNATDDTTSNWFVENWWIFLIIFVFVVIVIVAIVLMSNQRYNRNRYRRF